MQGRIWEVHLRLGPRTLEKSVRWRIHQKRRRLQERVFFLSCHFHKCECSRLIVQQNKALLSDLMWTIHIICASSYSIIEQWQVAEYRETIFESKHFCFDLQYHVFLCHFINSSRVDYLLLNIWEQPTLFHWCQSSSEPWWPLSCDAGFHFGSDHM